MDFLHRAVKGTLLVFIGILIGFALITGVFAASRGSFFSNVFGLNYFYDKRLSELPVTAGSGELTALAFSVLDSIKSRDYEALADFSHPELGIVFSPYATINYAKCKSFMTSEIKRFGGSTDSYVWGVFDGSGDPIEMTVSEYFDRFVYNRDFLSASQIGVDYIVKSGNALENTVDVFPGARFVDFHLPGDEKNDGLDWASLRLIFEEYGDTLRLTALIHSEWTV